MNDTELLKMSVDPPRWAIDGVIPEGLTLLAGQPKSGKSWLILDAAMAVANGSAFLGTEATQGDVLYLALEDGPYRLKTRLTQWNAQHDGKATGAISFEIEWPSAADGGLDQLENVLADMPNLRMVIVDTLAKVQPVSGSYNQAYPAITRLAKLARENHVALVAIHHAYRGLRSGGNKPPIESIQGSIGLSAAADSILVLSRDSASPDNGSLYMTGKDVEQANIALEWSPSGWQRAGTKSAGAGDPKVSPMRREILEYVTEHPSSDARDIAAGVGRTYEASRQLLWQMREAGLLTRDAGRYSLPSTGEGEIAS